MTPWKVNDSSAAAAGHLQLAHFQDAHDLQATQLLSGDPQAPGPRARRRKGRRPSDCDRRNPKWRQSTNTAKERRATRMKRRRTDDGDGRKSLARARRRLRAGAGKKKWKVGRKGTGGPCGNYSTRPLHRSRLYCPVETG